MRGRDCCHVTGLGVIAFSANNSCLPLWVLGEWSTEVRFSVDQNNNTEATRKSMASESNTWRAENNLVRTGTLKSLEFREPVKFQVEFFFIRNPDLLGNGSLPIVVQDSNIQSNPSEMLRHLVPTLRRERNLGPDSFRSRKLHETRIKYFTKLKIKYP
jgi:hypothetical protein